MTAPAHLSEAERQGAADGTLDREQLPEVQSHLAVCASCAADVARMGALMQHVREKAGDGAIVSGAQRDLWASIRSRIEASKIVRIDPASAHGRALRARRPWLAIVSTAAAAVLLIAALAEMQGWRQRPSVASQPSPDAAFASAVDSARSYEDESRRLLNELEMQRAMMGPATAASFDGDLAIIDRSIAEQKAALARDPHNLALQRLLAASYRQKVELLERANNAG